MRGGLELLAAVALAMPGMALAERPADAPVVLHFS